MVYTKKVIKEIKKHSLLHGCFYLLLSCTGSGSIYKVKAINPENVRLKQDEQKALVHFKNGHTKEYNLYDFKTLCTKECILYCKINLKLIT